MSFRMASKQAVDSPFVQHRVGAVVVKNGRVLATGMNHLRYTKEFKRSNVHAEEDAILKLLKARKLSSLSGADIYVTRFTKGGKVGMAKPCCTCDALIRSVGIRNVYFTTDGPMTDTYRC